MIHLFSEFSEIHLGITIVPFPTGYLLPEIYRLIFQEQSSLVILNTLYFHFIVKWANL